MDEQETLEEGLLSSAFADFYRIFVLLDHETTLFNPVEDDATVRELRELIDKAVDICLNWLG